MKKNEKRIQWIDSLKLFSIFLVVFGHMIAYSSNLNMIHMYIYSFHVPLFFFISGILYKNSSNFVKKKFKSLYLPYVFWALVFIIPYLLFSSGIKNSVLDKGEFSFFQLLLGVLYGIGSSIPQNSPLWFLPTLFLVSIVYNLIDKIIVLNVDKKNIVLLFAFFIVSLCVLLLDIPMLPLGLNIVPIMSMFFILGVAYSKKEWLIKSDFFIIVCIFLGMFLSLFNNEIRVMSNYYDNFLIFMISSLFSIVGYVSLFNKKAKKFFLSNIGKDTLYILIFHKLFVLVFQTKLGFLTKLLREGTFMEQLIISIFGSLVSICMCLIIKKVKDEIINFINERRKK